VVAKTQSEVTGGWAAGLLQPTRTTAQARALAFIQLARKNCVMMDYRHFSAGSG
jgi:hypothetical protein